MKNVENRLKNISNLLKTADKNLSKANKLMDAFIQEIVTSLDEVPGVLGVFDGECMIDATGKKYEINPNYVAKSLLVIGDNLKMVENEKKEKLFKQVSKVPRKKLTGILNKKEGKWYALTDAGSYRLLDVAIDFRHGEINDEVTVLIPEEDPNVEWAALESMAKDEVVKEQSTEVPSEKPAEVTTPDAEKVEEVIASTPKVEQKEQPSRPAPRPNQSNRSSNNSNNRGPRRGKSTKGGQRRNDAPRKPREDKPGLTAVEVNSLLDDDDLR